MEKRRQGMKNKGFTILEILVVISVIAILIGIAIPRFKGMQDEANTLKAKAELKTFQAAMESYRNNHSTYALAITDMENAPIKIVDTGLTNPLLAGSHAYELNLSPTDGSLYYVIYAPSVSGGYASVASTGKVTISNAYCVSNGTGCGN